MKNKNLAIISVILGIILIIIAVIYWTVPAGSLPALFPGHITNSAQIHVKHGIGALVLALALFAFAWFKSGPSSQE